MNEPRDLIHDLAVIGGGINGAGIAADAAGRGLKVYLCEQHDLANHTSSASSKLIHGGLRYLEHREFRLVREALAEREVLLAKAPHIIKPLRFILPHRPHLRPGWMIRVGLFCYDHLGRRRTLPGSRALRLGADGPLQADMTRGFEYSDCWVDDARLVVLNAMAARERGARVETRTRCLSAEARDGIWTLELEHAGGGRRQVRARALVNACGPWVAEFLRQGLRRQPRHAVRLVQGSHIVVPRLYPGEQAYILQNEDRRIVFVIPWLEHFSLIGTTDRDYQGDPARARIGDEEIQYLLGVVNRHFRRPIEARDILHSFSGVRPLLEDESGDPSAVTRDYFLELHGGAGDAPLLSVFGGKLTTYRRLAEAALDLLKPWLPGMGPRWTARAALPGGEEMNDPQSLANELVTAAPWLPVELARRWAGSYGSRSWRLLDNTLALEDLGEHIGAGLYAREVDYLRDEEWARSAEDILWRRSKLGLFMTRAEQARLAALLEAHPLAS
ncbi:MAG TPA: glycerol-3-phosphate dehydrogenase [Pseudomonas sp.]|nr:glycerol-3-phosphate dehydrogenase [Pseudomonas sp.]